MALKKYVKNILAKFFAVLGFVRVREEIMVLESVRQNGFLKLIFDEIISNNLKKEILVKKKMKNFDYFYIKLLNFVGSKPIKFGWMACMAPDGKFCFFRKNLKNGIKALFIQVIQ